MALGIGMLSGVISCLQETYILVKWSESCLVVSDSLWPHGLYSPWNSPGQNTWMGSLSLLQRIFQTQGSNPGFPHCRRILNQLSHKGSPCFWFYSVQSLSCVWLFMTPWTATHQVSLFITNSWSLLKHMSWISDDIQLSHPLSSPSPSAFSLSQHQGLFKWVSSLHQVAKVLEFQLWYQSFQ